MLVIEDPYFFLFPRSLQKTKTINRPEGDAQSVPPHIAMSPSLVPVSLYLVELCTVAPMYDILVETKSDVYASSREAIIQIARKALFDAVNKLFKGGVEASTDQEFLLEKLDEYDKDYFEGIWGTCDMASNIASPDGPAWVHVYELIPSPTGQGPFIKTLIYKLPRGRTGAETDS
jgi:hypothetical protein